MHISLHARSGQSQRAAEALLSMVVSASARAHLAPHASTAWRS